MLVRDKCYMLDCDVEVYVWVGRSILIIERKMLIVVVEVRRFFFSNFDLNFLS